MEDQSKAPEDNMQNDIEKLEKIVEKLKQEAISVDRNIAIEKAKFHCLSQEWYIWEQIAMKLDTFGMPNECSTPIEKIPDELLDDFTMGGLADVEYTYSNTTYPDNWPLIYTDMEIDYYLEKIKNREWYIYGMTDVWMWEAIERFPIKGLDVVNMGSITPWYESNCLYHGANSTTIDYNKIITLTDRIKTMTIAEWDDLQPTFDVAWSISSFEHDGLGMYGDPIDPNGDMKAMDKMKRILKPGGLLFLSVPVGKDKILFNNARIYGRHRLAKITEGWEQLATFGLEEVHFTGPGHLQPIIVLRNPA